jgi:hypothetical protein
VGLGPPEIERTPPRGRWPASCVGRRRASQRFRGVGLSGFLLFVTRAQEDGLTTVTVALLAVAVLSGGLFERTEWCSPEPLLPLRLFRSPSLAYGALASLLNFMAGRSRGRHYRATAKAKGYGSLPVPSSHGSDFIRTK